MAARPSWDRLSVCKESKDRKAVAADGGGSDRGRKHPEVRRDRHPSCCQPQCHRRSADVSGGHWNGKQGGSPKVPEEPMGPATVAVEGTDPGKLAGHLWEHYRIIVTPIVHPEFQGLRVTPNIYTTIGDIDTFCDAME